MQGRDFSLCPSVKQFRWLSCLLLSPDEMYEILSNLPESVAYTCINCTEQHPAEWRLALEKELQISLKQVLTALLNSRTTSHLLRYRQVSWSLCPVGVTLAWSVRGTQLSCWGVALPHTAEVSASYLEQHMLWFIFFLSCVDSFGSREVGICDTTCEAERKIG